MTDSQEKNNMSPNPQSQGAYNTFIIPALSKESILFSVRPSVRPKEKFVTGTPSTGFDK